MERTIKERSFLILSILANRSERLSINDLARQTGMSRRSVYRYITALRQAGYVVETNHHNVRLSQDNDLGDQLRKFLYFNKKEADLLFHSLNTIETDVELRESLKRKLSSLFGTREDAEKQERVNHYQVPRLLDIAIKERRCAVFEGYSSPHSNTSKDREVEPFQFSEDGKYIWAYELESGRNKVYRVSRIRSVKVLQRHWRESRLHQAGYTDAFKMISFDGSTTLVRIRMNRLAYNLLLEEYPDTERDVTFDESTQEWIYSAPVSNMKGIGRFVIGLSDCIRIETPELRSYVRYFAMKHILGTDVVG